MGQGLCCLLPPFFPLNGIVYVCDGVHLLAYVVNVSVLYSAVSSVKPGAHFPVDGFLHTASLRHRVGVVKE